MTSSTGEGIGLLVGPAFGGFLLAFGTPVVALAGAVGMALATIAVTQIRPDRRIRPVGWPEVPAHGGGRSSPGALAGVRALRARPTVMVVMAVFGVQPFVRGALTVLIVVASIELLGLGDPGVGLLNAAIGLGGIVGAVGTILLVGRDRLAGVLLLSLVAWGIPISVMGLVPIAWVAVAAMVVVGVANGVLDVAGFTTLQRIIPNDVRSSVLGLFEGNVAAMAAIGGLVAPILISAFGVAGALVATGAILPVAVLLSASRVLKADDISLVPARELGLLRGVAMFAPLPLGAIEELAGSLEPLTFGPGEPLMRAGDVGDRFILIDSGTVEVEAAGAPVRTIGPGGYCGEIALLRGVPRTATVRAITDVTAFGLRGQDFIAVVTGDHEAVRWADQGRGCPAGESSQTRRPDRSDRPAAGYLAGGSLRWKPRRPSSGLLHGRIPDPLGDLGDVVTDPGEAPIELAAAHDLAKVGHGQQSGHALAVDPLELALGLDRLVRGVGGGLAVAVVAGSEPVERLGELADALGQASRHPGHGGVGRYRHDLGLADRVLRPVQDGIEPARHDEQVLGSDRGDEGGLEMASELLLEVVRPVLGIADPVAPGRDPRSPTRPVRPSLPSSRRPAVAASRGRRGSRAGTSSTFPASDQPPCRNFQIGNEIAAMRPAAGIVVSQASAISRTTPQLTCRQRERPMPMPTIELETTCVVLTGAPTRDATKMTLAEDD